MKKKRDEPGTVQHSNIPAHWAEDPINYIKDAARRDQVFGLRSLLYDLFYQPRMSDPNQNGEAWAKSHSNALTICELIDSFTSAPPVMSEKSPDLGVFRGDPDAPLPNGEPVCYVVVGQCGEYISNTKHWIVRSFAHKSAAKDFLKMLHDTLGVFALNLQPSVVDNFKGEDFDNMKAKILQLDPQFTYDYSGTTYKIEPAPHVSASHMTWVDDEDDLEGEEPEPPVRRCRGWDKESCFTWACSEHDPDDGEKTVNEQRAEMDPPLPPLKGGAATIEGVEPTVGYTWIRHHRMKFHELDVAAHELDVDLTFESLDGKTEIVLPVTQASAREMIKGLTIFLDEIRRGQIQELAMTLTNAPAEHVDAMLEKMFTEVCLTKPRAEEK